ncbi:MAG: DUF4124 domain-containing protein [Thiogranum sp.]|nr:DUF4124 domain-containing protein [Thiogranum sp.]
MKRFILPLAAGLGTVIAQFGALANADEIYRWVTPDGVTHFSESAPEAELASVEVFDLEVAEPVQTAPRDYRSMLEVANSIEAGRLERERLRLEQRRLDREQRAAEISTAEDYAAPAARIYYPLYPGHRRPPGDRHFHDKPRLRPVPGPFPEKRQKPRLREDRPNSLTHIAPR